MYHLFKEDTCQCRQRLGLLVRLLDYRAVSVYPVCNPFRQFVFTQFGSSVIAHRRNCFELETWFHLNVLIKTGIT